MEFKPSDLFLGVVSFLGVLLPGAVFVFLLEQHLPPTVGSQLANWKAFALSAYVVGHVLLATSEILNQTVDWVSKHITPDFYNKLAKIEVSFRKVDRRLMSTEKANEKADQEKHEVEDLKDRGFCFHSALSYVRLRSAAAADEVDHHMADYKMLRNLVLVLLVNAAVELIVPNRSFKLGISEAALGLLSYWCFIRMYNWARYLAFDYAVKIDKLPSVAEKK